MNPRIISLRITILPFLLVGLLAGAADKKTPKAPKQNNLAEEAKEAIKYNQIDKAIEAYRQILSTGGEDSKQREEAYHGLMEVLGKKGDQDGVQKVATEMLNDKAVGADKHFEAQIILIGMKAVKSNTALNKDEVQALAKQFEKEGMKGHDQQKALQNAAACFIRSKDNDIARAFVEMADAMVVKQPKKSYVCSFVDKAPLGAGGWFSSQILQDEKKLENRFDPYDKKSAETLFTDATVERMTTEDKGIGYYQKNTGFYMVYDTAGWHIFVKSGEPKTEDFLADGGKAGSLEMYFTPGLENETYYQWMLDLPKSEPTVVDWNSPHKGYRSLKGVIKVDTVAQEKNWGTYICIPWEAVYDKLPFDRENGDWRFNCIRFTPAGGITWGGLVHETGKWGLIKWEKPEATKLAEIKRNILRKAWAKYQKDKTALQTFWEDKVLGDQDFYQKSLKPQIERLDKLGAKMKNPRDIPDDEVDRLYKDVVADWMEFDYLTSDLRKDYLEQKLMM